MKCDELQPLVFSINGFAYVDESAVENNFENPHDHAVYKATEVDAAIAELKARIADLEKLNHDLCERVTENNDIRLHWEEIEQTRAENESLKAKLESVQATAYADSVDAGMRERRLKRALYKACANWIINRQVAMACYHLEARAKKFEKAIEKCLKKLEEYK